MGDVSEATLQRSAAITESPVEARSAWTLAAAVLGFFVVTFDAVVVNVALPSIRDDVGASVTGLQWVVDGYTLMFAAFLIASGSLADRIGARRSFVIGLVFFVVASAACGLAPSLGMLVAARFAQGSAAAMMMPASMALLGQAFPDHTGRAKAVAIWAMGGAIASSSGPVLGGLLTLVSWRLIFFINLPVGALAVGLLARTTPSPRRRVSFDPIGQVTGMTAIGALTYAAIEAGATSLTNERVLVTTGIAIVAAVTFVIQEARVAHPMVPLGLFRSRDVSVSVAVGFAFVVGYYGLPFLMSLYLQQIRGLSPLQAGACFVPMMVTGAILTPVSARLVERFGAKRIVITGLACMAAGLVLLAALTGPLPVWALAALMILPGLAGPLVSPPITAVLLNSVPDESAGTASGVFNTSRQVGGALAIAVFGALVAGAS